MKRISAQAYQALRDALPTITWNKRPFEVFLRDALRDHPELLRGLDFERPKRETSEALIDRLAANEDRHQATTVALMLEVADITQFPNIEQMEDPDDRAKWLQIAQDAVGRLRTLVAPYREWAEAAARSASEREARAADEAAARQRAIDLEALRLRYLALHSSSDDPQRRGVAFEALLADLFALFKMRPRGSYRLEHEQIDGALSFDSDDYIVEARWRKEPTGREHLDVFKIKVERKGRNTLGIFVSVNGFTSDALAEYRTSSPFVTFTGQDLYMVLEGRVGLDALLRAKKRHVNETGNCDYPATELLIVP